MAAKDFYLLAKIYQFKAKNSESKPYPLRLGNISKDFTANNMKKQDQMDLSTDFWVIIILLMLVILPIFINMYWKCLEL